MDIFRQIYIFLCTNCRNFQATRPQIERSFSHLDFMYSFIMFLKVKLVSKRFRANVTLERFYVTNAMKSCYMALQATFLRELPAANLALETCFIVHCINKQLSVLVQCTQLEKPRQNSVHNLQQAEISLTLHSSSSLRVHIHVTYVKAWTYM